MTSLTETPERQRHARLAAMMIDFLRASGYAADADFSQMLYDGDGSATSVESSVYAIIEHHLKPPVDMIDLFDRVHDECFSHDEDYQAFCDYLRELNGISSSDTHDGAKVQ